MNTNDEQRTIAYNKRRALLNEHKNVEDNEKLLLNAMKAYIFLCAVIRIDMKA